MRSLPCDDHNMFTGHLAKGENTLGQARNRTLAIGKVHRRLEISVYLEKD